MTQYFIFLVAKNLNFQNYFFKIKFLLIPKFLFFRFLFFHILRLKYFQIDGCLKETKQVNLID